MDLALMDEPETGREPERARYTPAALHGTSQREGLLWLWGIARKHGHWPQRDSRDDDATLGAHVRGRVFDYRPPQPDALTDLSRAYDLAGLSKVERDVLRAYYVEGLGGKWRDRGELGDYWRHVEAHYAEHKEMPRTALSAGAAVNASAVGDGRVAERLHMSRRTAMDVRWRAIRKMVKYLNGDG
jgi:hypothetical protein